MIYQHFVHFRLGFALPGATIGDDGLPEFPSATKLRASGFSNYSVPLPAFPYSSSLAIVTPSGDFRALMSAFDGFASVPVVPDADPDDPPIFPRFPLTITCNNVANDAVSGVHEYDWYLSQRADHERVVPIESPPVHRRQYLTITHPNVARSGTVEIDINPSVVQELLPGYTATTLVARENLTIMLKYVHLYVQRRSDKAYQWAPLYVV